MMKQECIEEPVVRGLIFDIQPLSLHDGPGIRTIVFCKGCPLSCKWCSNPESQYHDLQWLYKQHLCSSGCANRLPGPAMRAVDELRGQPHPFHMKIEDNRRVMIDKQCPNGALQMCGRQVDTVEIMHALHKDRSFFGEDGGVTLSGGEPFLQFEFIMDILRRCREQGIHTAIETSLYTSFDRIEAVLPFLGFFMFDIKIISEERHRYCCGVDNRVILENIRRLVKIARIPLLPRMPVIPGVNDDEENIRATAAFLRANDLHYINLVPYMRLGIGKYPQVARHYELAGIEPPTGQHLAGLKALFYSEDIFCL